MEETPPVHSATFIGILTDSKRITKANYTHFLTLSLLFLPLSLSLITNPTLNFSDHLITTVNHHLQKLPPNHHQNTSLRPLLYILIVYLLSVCATAMITYSTHTSFSGKPVSFSASIVSLIYSFFPLVTTAIVANLLLVLISISFILLICVILVTLQTLGFVIDYNSVEFVLFSAIVGAVLFVIIIHFHVNWSLAFVVVVVESKWGYTPLMRSSYLVKGLKTISLSILLFYGMIGGVLVYVYSLNWLDNGLSRWGVFTTLLGSCFLMLLLLQNTSANTVLYSYCKALHGELAVDVGELGHEYVSLPSEDGEKAPEIITVVTVS